MTFVTMLCRNQRLFHRVLRFGAFETPSCVAILVRSKHRHVLRSWCVRNTVMCCDLGVFETPYHRTFVEVGAHMHFVDSLDFTKFV